MSGVKAPTSRQPWLSSTGAISAIADAKSRCLPRTSWIVTCRYTAVSSVTPGSDLSCSGVFVLACQKVSGRADRPRPELSTRRPLQEEVGDAVRREGPARDRRRVRARRCRRAPVHGGGRPGGGGRPRRREGAGGGR